MRTYGEYKEAGIGWLTDIPEHWQVKPLYTIFKKNQQKNTALSESNVLSLSYGNIVRRDLSDNFGLIPESFNTYQIVKPGFIILRLTDLQNDKRSLRVGLVKDNGIITSAYIGLVGTEQIDSTYFYFQLHAYDLLKVFYNFGSGVRQTMSFEDLRRLPLIIPSYEEQVRIADYLTNKIIQIDKLISDKEKLIELLNEERTAIINQVVTKGIDPDVPMKDSDVDWLGKIPQHWSINKLKHTSLIRYGLGQPPKQKDGGLKIIRATNIFRGLIKEENMIFVDPEDIPWNRNPLLKKDEIIIVRSGAYTGDSAIITDEYAGCVTGYDIVITPKKINPEFLAYSLLSTYLLDNQLYLERLRAAQPHLNSEEIGSCFIIEPPMAEQEKIVDLIRNEHTRVDKIIETTKKEIALLKEYKIALISEVVSGKVDVRNEIVSETENLTLAS